MSRVVADLRARDLRGDVGELVAPRGGCLRRPVPRCVARGVSFVGSREEGGES